MRELDLSAIRARLENKSGPTYWRSLEELAETPAFTEFLHREFPSQASEFTDPAGRRTFLKLMGASLALAGAAGCTVSPTKRSFRTSRRRKRSFRASPCSSPPR